MAVELRQGLAPTPQVFNLPTDGATAITRGALLYVDPSPAGGGTVVPADGTNDLTTTPLFIAQETIAASGTTINCSLVNQQPVYEVDCAADTNANQVLKRHNMSTSLLVDNTSTTDATTVGHFLMLETVGATTARRCLGIFLNPGHVTA